MKIVLYEVPQLFTVRVGRTEDLLPILYVRILKMIFVIALLVLYLPVGAKSVIHINNQQDFDSLNTMIYDAIIKGENNIIVTLSSGPFVFKNNHIIIEDVVNPRLRMKIKGNKTILIPDGEEYHNGDLFEGTLIPSDCWMSNEISINNWSHIQYSEGLIEIVNKEEKICRLKTKEAFNNNSECDAYILIPHWFKSSVYRIDHIANNYIYFYVSDMSSSISGDDFSINDDYNIYNKPIRYKVWNVENNDWYFRLSKNRIYLSGKVTTLRRGIAQRVLSVKGCSINSLNITGIDFRGASNQDETPAFLFESTIAKSISFNRCVFNGFRNDVISLSDVGNATVSNCLFKNCWNYCIKSDNLCENTNIDNNRFELIGEAMLNTTAVLCSGMNYLIENNVFRDYGYGGVSAGVWYGYEKVKEVRGIIQNNQFYFTKDYYDHIDNYAIMDGGAIYLFTKHDETIVRGNFINGYTGMASNRGIFCDDGAFNIQIYGNAIINTPNSYSIDSRRVPIVENLPESGISEVNVNNVIKGNIIDGGVFFCGNERINNSCYYGGNFIIRHNNGHGSVINNVIFEEDDFSISTIKNNTTSIELMREDYSFIRKSDYWRWLHPYLMINH